MACSITSEKDLEQVRQNAQLEHMMSGSLPIAAGTKIKNLPRGGCVVETSIGNIQYGMPPETVKDCMNLGIEVPIHFIIPTNRFDQTYGLNVAEFEFPAYFNFFIRRKRVNLICSEEAQRAVKVIFQETLLGPLAFDDFREDFSSSFDEAAIPDMAREQAHFAKNPFNPSEKLSLDTLISFTVFDERGIATIEGGKVRVKVEEGHFLIFDGEELIAKLVDRVTIRVESEFRDYDLREMRTPSATVPLRVYQPPTFGVTVLGCSHGFDPKGSTSGYIFWLNGRGVMVDPPPFSTVLLKNLGIASTLIESVIISHCHADHDAGTFQKILDSQQIQIITTRTILGSFVRKYSALTGMAEPYIRSLFTFRPAKIGEDIIVHGAKFRFFYSLHSIPCIGFSVSLGDQSIYFSADTFYDPEGLQKLVEAGVITNRRFKSLSENKWNHQVILHEAGVPPIHTPMKIFMTLPREVIERLYLVHVAEKDIPVGFGLKSAKPGVENTIVLAVKHSDEYTLIQNIDLLCSVPIFEDLSVRCARDLLQVMKEECYAPKHVIVEEGTYGDKFYLIKSGIVKVFSHKANNEFERYMSVGDYFGESAVVGDFMRHATCVAATEVLLLSIEREDFWMIFGNVSSGASVLKRLMNLKDSRKSSGFKVLLKNSLLSGLSGFQKTQLEVLLKEESYVRGSLVWQKGETVDKLVIVGSGVLRFKDCKESEMGEFNMGDLIGEMDALLKGGVHRTTLESTTPSVVFAIKKTDFLHFLKRNPGLNVIFSNLLVAE